MSTIDAILATLAVEPPGECASSRSVRGRTSLQKQIYFLSVLSNEDFGFRPHYYGPYSSHVSTDLSALVEADLVEESRVGYGVATEFGEVSRYDYRLSESGKHVVERRPEIVAGYKEYLDKIHSSGVSADPNTISIAAKVHFIVSGQGNASVDQIQDMAGSLGWSISEDSVNSVVEYLKRLELVKAQ